MSDTGNLGVVFYGNVLIHAGKRGKRRRKRAPLGTAPRGDQAGAGSRVEGSGGHGKGRAEPPIFA